MARHTFVTDVESRENLLGVVTEIYQDKETVEILSRSDVLSVAEGIGKETKNDMDRLSKRMDKALSDLRESVNQAKSVAEASQRSVDKLVGNVRDAFASSVEEILRPQYDTLARILEAATAPTAPESEFHEKALQSLSNFGRILEESFASVDMRLKAIGEENARNRQSIELMATLLRQLSDDIRNPPKKKSFFQRLFSRK